MFRLLRNTTLVLWLLISFGCLALSASIWGVSQTIRVAALSKAVAAQAIQNRHQIARLKAKARLRRAFVSVPLVGLGAVAYFEDKDRRDWLEANPDKTNLDYACEVGELTVEVMDEVLAELPKEISLPDWAVPQCEREA